MTLVFSVRNAAPFNDNRPLPKSHLLPISKLVDSCGFTLGLFWLFGCALSVKFALPGGVTDVPYETYALPALLIRNSTAALPLTRPSAPSSSAVVAPAASCDRKLVS